MKQHISSTQLNELSEKGKQRLKSKYPHWIHSDHDRDSDSWCYSCAKTINMEDDAELDSALLSIGQMIEFLDEHNAIVVADPHVRVIQDDGVTFVVGGKTICWWNQELCDALFESVKQILEKDNK